MPVAITVSAAGLQFRLAGRSAARMLAWVDWLDHVVLREQLATGSYRGRFPRPAGLAADWGPRYGVDGHWRCYGLNLSPEGARCWCAARHPAASRPFVWMEEVVGQECAAVQRASQRPAIAESEWASLAASPHWTHADAVAGRYAYDFARTGLGCCIRVRDRVSQAEIDVTDYDRW